MIRFWVGFKGFGYEKWKSVNFLDFVPYVCGRTPWVGGENEVGKKCFLFLFFPLFFPFSPRYPGGRGAPRWTIFPPMIPMFMNCEHLGAFCVFVCYALFVMFNYYPFYVTLCPFPYCSITSFNRVSCEKRIKPTVGWEAWEILSYPIAIQKDCGFGFDVFRGVFYFIFIHMFFFYIPSVASTDVFFIHDVSGLL